jgi:hypothetical protein
MNLDRSDDNLVPAMKRCAPFNRQRRPDLNPARPMAAAACVLLAAAFAGLLLACGGRASAVPARPDGGHHVTWPAPSLRNPITIALRPGRTNLRLDSRRDYLLRLPSDRPLDAPGGLRISGGHHVVLIGGAIRVRGKAGGMLLQGQTGTVHIEGVRLFGPGMVEGIDLSEGLGAVVQLQNIWIDEVHGSQRTNHADLIQTWAGPRRLRVDGLVGKTGYQGFFLLPNQHFRGAAPKRFDLRNVFIDAATGGYALWRQTHPGFPLSTRNVWVTPNARKSGRDLWLWPKPSSGDRSWDRVREGRPRDVIKRVRAAGVNY